MSQFFVTLGIVFFAFLVFALFLNYCRRKIRKSPHGLTGMCHKDGGPACRACKVNQKKTET